MAGAGGKRLYLVVEEAINCFLLLVRRGDEGRALGQAILAARVHVVHIRPGEQARLGREEGTREDLIRQSPLAVLTEFAKDGAPLRRRHLGTLRPARGRA